MQKENGDHNLKIKNAFNLKGTSDFIMDLENYFKNAKIYIWKEIFAIIKSKKIYPNAFANIIDKNETTGIIKQSKYNDEDVIEIEKDWKILTF